MAFLLSASSWELEEIIKCSQSDVATLKKLVSLVSVSVGKPKMTAHQ